MESQPTTDSIRTLVYDRLGLDDNADFDAVLTAVDQTDGVVEDEVRAGGVLLAIGQEIYDYSRQTGYEADAAFQRSLQKVRSLPFKPEEVRKMDQDLFGICLDILRDPDCSYQEKSAAELMSLSLGVDQIGKSKGAMIVKRHDQAGAEERKAIEAYLAIADLNLDSIKQPSQLEQGLAKMTATMQKLTELPKQRAGAVAVAGIFGLGLTASPAAALGAGPPSVSIQAGLNTSQSNAEISQLEQSLSQSENASLGSVSIDPDLLDVQPAVRKDGLSLAQPTEATPQSVKITAGLNQKAAAPTEPKNLASATEQVPATVKIKAGADTKDEETTPSQPAGADKPQTPAATQTKPEIKLDDQSNNDTPVPETVPVQPDTNKTKPSVDAADNKPLEISVPDNNVNQAPDETPAQTIDRLVQSHDIDATSYAIRKLYSVNGPDAKPVNEKLSTAIDNQTDALKQQILNANHSDPNYTDKALTALAYLNAAAKDPTILNNQDIAAFLSDLSDLGEYYHDQIYDPYLDDAAAKLASDDYGAFNGIDEKYQAMLENAYAYASFGGMSDNDQDAKIDAIQDAEAAAAKQAADENAKRQADEETAKSAGTISPESQALQDMIDRATDDNQKRTYIAFKYFIDHGFTPEQATGIVGNLLVESAGTMNPGIKQGGGGPGRGIAQWGSWNKDGSIGGRFTGLVNFAKAQGKNWDDLTVQLDFVMYEFTNGNLEKKAFNNIKAAQTPRDATYAFMHWYERPRDQSDKATDTRTSRGTPVLDAYHQNVDRVNQERAAAAAAAQKAAEEKAAQEAAEKAAAAKQLSNDQGNELLAMYKDESDENAYQRSYNEIDNYQCVSFVKFVMMKYSQTHPDNNFFAHMGNGKDVAAQLGKEGYAVDHTPAPLAIVSLPAGFNTGKFVTNKEYGHTALVIRVEANGDVVLAQTGAPEGVHYKYLSTISADKAAQLTYAHTENDLASILSDPDMQGK